MATFNVVFSGELVAGADAARVRANLAKLFKTDEARVAKLFSNTGVTLKKGLDEAAARKYQEILSKAGAIVDIVADKATESAAAASAGNTLPARAAAGKAAENPPVAPDLTVAEVGATLVEHKPVAAPSIDVGHLSMAEVGSDLVEHKPVPEPQFDLSELSLDPPGTTLSDTPSPPPADIDTSELALEK